MVTWNESLVKTVVFFSQNFKVNETVGLRTVPENFKQNCYRIMRSKQLLLICFYYWCAGVNNIRIIVQW